MSEFGETAWGAIGTGAEFGVTAAVAIPVAGAVVGTGIALGEIAGAAAELGADKVQQGIGVAQPIPPDQRQRANDNKRR